MVKHNKRFGKDKKLYKAVKTFSKTGNTLIPKRFSNKKSAQNKAKSIREKGLNAIVFSDKLGYYVFTAPKKKPKKKYPKF